VRSDNSEPTGRTRRLPVDRDRHLAEGGGCERERLPRFLAGRYLETGLRGVRDVDCVSACKFDPLSGVIGAQLWAAPTGVVEIR